MLDDPTLADAVKRLVAGGTNFGQPEPHTHDYRRAGTTDLFAVLDIQAGRVTFYYARRHRFIESRAFLNQIEATVPKDLDLHLVLDNAATDKTKLIQDWLLKHPRWHLHFTPASASWLNLVEGWFALLTRRQRQRGVFETTSDLETAIDAYIDQTTAEPKPFVWNSQPTPSSPASNASARKLPTQTTSWDSPANMGRPLDTHYQGGRDRVQRAGKAPRMSVYQLSGLRRRSALWTPHLGRFW